MCGSIGTRRQRNIEKHGIDFADVGPVFDAPMLVWIDAREDYGEARYIGVGSLEGRTVTLVWAEHREIRWIISARRAHAKERKRYWEATGE